MGDTVPFNRKDSDAQARDDERIYSNEEVSEIIGVALRNAQSGDGSTVNHSEMLSIASEFGLGGGDIQRALQELAEKQDLRETSEMAALAFKLHVMAFAAICTGLFLINMISVPSFWWFLYPVVCWGSVIMLHGIAVRYLPPTFWMMLDPALGEHFNGRGAWSGQLDGSGRAPFYIDEVYGSIAKANGIAEITDDALVLEYEIADSWFGAIKSKVREVIVPFEEISGVRFQRSMWNTKLSLQGRRMSTFSDVPMAKSGEVTLMFQREHRGAAEHLARELAEKAGR